MALRNRGGKWSYRFMVDGHEYSGATGLAATKRNETAASKIEAEHQQAVTEGRAPSRRIKARTFADASAEYMALRDADCRAHPATARRIRTSFASLRRHFGGQMTAAIGPADVDAYKTWRITQHQVRDVTLRHDLHALSGFYRWAIRAGYAGQNPVAEVAIPSDRDAVRIHVLSAAEERAYFEAALRDADLHDFSRVLILQGMRPDELMRLSLADVDLASGSAVIQSGKTRAARRTLTLTAESRSILASRGAELAQGGVFFPLSYSGMVGKHQRACKAAGVDFVLYDLRHTFATRMAQAGCDLATLAAILGHSSLRIVPRYVHPTAEHQAAAMRRFDSSLQASAHVEAVQ